MRKDKLKAIILAAGRGHRLLPHTNELPKCLIEVNGRPIIEYQLNALKENGFLDEDIVIVIGHCGHKLREYFASRPVTIIENDIYASTNSSYSLWLTKEFMYDGFIYINSDLIFSQDHLYNLLKDDSKCGIIVDNEIHIEDDMFKAKVEKGHIIKMSKTLQASEADTSVVGPAKFDKISATLIIDILAGYIDSGEKNFWCYKIFGDLAKNHPFSAIENKNYFWAEVDNCEDLQFAIEKMPTEFIDFPKKENFS